MNHLKNGANLKWAKKKLHPQIFTVSLNQREKIDIQIDIQAMSVSRWRYTSPVFTLLNLTPHLAVINTRNLNTLFWIRRNKSRWIITIVKILLDLDSGSQVWSKQKKKQSVNAFRGEPTRNKVPVVWLPLKKAFLQTIWKLSNILL